MLAGVAQAAHPETLQHFVDPHGVVGLKELSCIASLHNDDGQLGGNPELVAPKVPTKR